MSVGNILTLVQVIGGAFAGLLLFIFFRIINGLNSGLKSEKKARKSLKKSFEKYTSEISEKSESTKEENQKQSSGIEKVENIHKACHTEMDKRISLIDGGNDPMKGRIFTMDSSINEKVSKHDYEKDIENFRGELKEVSSSIKNVENIVHVMEVSMSDKFATKIELKESQDRIFSSIDSLGGQITNLYQLILDNVNQKPKQKSIIAPIIPPPHN